MYKVGSLVKLKCSCLGNPSGTKGYVYETYRDFDNPTKFGISVIFTNGEYDGFSVRDQDLFLELIENTNTSYNFINVMQLSNDFARGHFNMILGIETNLYGKNKS